MRIITKKTRVIQMSKEELDTFVDLCMQAKEGRMTHSAETKLFDGSFLGVSVLTPEQAAELQKQRDEAEQRRYDERQRRLSELGRSYGSLYR